MLRREMAVSRGGGAKTRDVVHLSHGGDNVVKLNKV